MMKVSDVVMHVQLDGTTVQVMLGDTVWYFPGNDLQAGPPQAAMVTALCEQGMVDLTFVVAQTVSTVRKAGVCIVGDPRLKQEPVQKRGSWIPRGNWSVLNLAAPG